MGYKKLKEKVDQTKIDKDAEVKAMEDTLEEFMKEQTFTGAELLKMRDEIRDGYHGGAESDELWLDYLLDRILTYREEHTDNDNR